MYTHILASTDGSELAQKGLDHALSLAKALGSKVTIITVTEPFLANYVGDGWAPSAEDLKRYDEESERAAAELLSRIMEDFTNKGVAAGTEHVTASSPAAAIVDAAERLGCNLIVMSSHGRRGIVRMLLGSQTSEVLSHSPVPVLVVR